jgi:hypothetical protein
VKRDHRKGSEVKRSKAKQRDYTILSMYRTQNNNRNSIQLKADLQSIIFNKDMRICSFDIEIMYTNTPKINTINIINNILDNNQEIDINIHKETLHILQTVMEQNYF